MKRLAFMMRTYQLVLRITALEKAAQQRPWYKRVFHKN